MRKRVNFVMFLLFFALLYSLDCYSESFRIQNIGFPGFNETNQEYTNNPNVVLLTEYNSSATICRYSNNNISWISPGNCTPNLFWQLTPGQGIKTVYANITYDSGDILAFQDTIFYNLSGGGLDTTPPISPTVVYPYEYTNNTVSLDVSWVGASDHESELLGIPLSYIYQVYLNGILEDTSEQTFSTHEVIDIDYGLVTGDNITIEVETINSAGLSSKTSNSGIIIDTDEPSLVNLVFSSLSSGLWSNTGTISFEWSATDSPSGILGYSYSIDKNPTDPDNTPEGDYENLEGFTSATIKNIDDGKFYFNIKAIDKATNFGGTFNYEIWIDKTPPSRPTMINPIVDSNKSKIHFMWQPSFDTVSGIRDYQIEISANNNFTDPDREVSNNLYLDYSSSFAGAIYARVRARNNAGLYSVWSNEKETGIDTTPPVIIRKMPQGKVASTNPRFFVQTDEDAECYYTKSGEKTQTKFSSTGTMHHEVYVNLPSVESLNSFTIRCTDTSNNSISSTISFEYTKALPDRITLFGSQNYYLGGIITLYLKIQSGSNNLEQVEKSNLKLYLNEETTDNFFLNDLGSGNYSLSLDSSQFTFLDGQNIMMLSFGTLNSNEFVISMLKPELTIVIRNIPPLENLSRIWLYNYKTFSYGFAIDSKIMTKMEEPQITTVSCPINDCNAIIFLTKKEFNKKSIDQVLRQAMFLKGVIPSFGYNPDQSFFVDLTLSYDEINIIGEETIPRGRHNLLIENVLKKENPQGRKSVRVTTHLEGTGEQVYKYD